MLHVTNRGLRAKIVFQANQFGLKSEGAVHVEARRLRLEDEHLAKEPDGG